MIPSNKPSFVRAPGTKNAAVGYSKKQNWYQGTSVKASGKYRPPESLSLSNLLILSHVLRYLIPQHPAPSLQCDAETHCSRAVGIIGGSGVEMTRVDLRGKHTTAVGS